MDLSGLPQFGLYGHQDNINTKIHQKGYIYCSQWWQYLGKEGSKMVISSPQHTPMLEVCMSPMQMSEDMSKWK